MAQQLIASIYGINGNAIGTSAGQPQGFPTQGIRIYPVPSAKTFNGVTMVSVIEVLPTGLNQQGNKHYTAAATATLITAANA